MQFLSIFIFACSFVIISHGYVYFCNNNSTANKKSCMLTMSPDEESFKKTLMEFLEPIDVLTFDFGLSDFSNDQGRINQTNKNIKEMVNQTVMEQFVKKLNLTYENPTNITLVTKEAMATITSKSMINTLIGLLPPIPGIDFLLNFLSSSV